MFLLFKKMPKHVANNYLSYDLLKLCMDCIYYCFYLLVIRFEFGSY